MPSAVWHTSGAYQSLGTRPPLPPGFSRALPGAPGLRYASVPENADRFRADTARSGLSPPSSAASDARPRPAPPPTLGVATQRLSSAGSAGELVGREGWGGPTRDEAPLPASTITAEW